MTSTKNTELTPAAAEPGTDASSVDLAAFEAGLSSAVPPTRFSTDDYLKFILPSLLGALIFLVPLSIGDKTTILFGFLTDYIKDNFKDLLAFLLVVVTAISAIFTLTVSLLERRAGNSSNAFLRIFSTTPLWVTLRVIGAIMVYMVILGTGPDWITSEATGGTVMTLLAPNLLVLFFLACLALPLLTDYGFMEFVGTLLSRAFQLIFRLPGRAAIDGLASWLGAAPIGVMLTVQQYEGGGYTRREAAVVATNFSIVSMPFCLVIASVVGLEHVFFQYYGCVILIGLVCALVMPRIPPLSLIANEYNPTTGKQVRDVVMPGESPWAAGVRLGTEKAQTGAGLGELIRKGLMNIADIWFGLLPATLAIATIALVLVEFTPVFRYLSMPFIPVLDWFGIAEAAQAAPALVVGFADMYLPALIGKGIDSEVTRFLIAILSVSQLIYMSEVGALLLRSNLGLNIGHLVLIFIIRTIIATPIAIVLAKYVIFA